MKIPRIVLTGGPCGGKTTAQHDLIEELARVGYRTICVPEVATLFFGSGFTIHDFLSDKVYHLQKGILQEQIALEDSLVRVAGVLSGKVLLLCDRGALDGKAYTAAADWERILVELGTDEGKLLARHDRVVHLTPHADGAEDHSSYQTNECRFESVKEALETDRKLRAAWENHPQHMIIPNEGGMARKLECIIRKLDVCVRL
ncbi:MAG: ATP-binding protein [Verrucomicrobiota bacterium]|nr:ATP-binding protein [Verrucomicrobiota bacterium]